MHVYITGKLPNDSTVTATGNWPEGAPLMPGLEVTFAQQGLRYTGHVEAVTIDLGDETNGRRAFHPIAITVTNVHDVRPKPGRSKS
jgi:hypothetical protein